MAALSLAAALLAVTLSTSDRSEAQTARLGDENSWLRIQNVGSLPATVDLDFYDVNGQLVAKDGCPRPNVCDKITSGSGRSFFQQTFEGLPVGYRGSGFLTSDQPFTALMARDLLRPDGTYQIAGESLRLGTGVSEYFLPMVVNNATHVSRIVIENTSETADACVEIVYHADGALSGGQRDPANPTGGCPQGGARIAPRGSMIRDELNIGAPAGFDGSARVRTYPTATGVPANGQQLAVMADTRARNGAGLASYRGIGSDEVSQVVLLPLVNRNASEGQSQFTTRFRIMNANPQLPNEVTLLFSGRDGNGAEIELETTVTVNGVLTCDQRGPLCMPPGKSLPATFIGTVRMQAVNPVAVIVQRLSADGSIADYRGFTGAEASTQVVMPVVDKNFGPFGGKRGWNSWFRVLAFDGSAAQVYVVYYGRQFPSGLFPQGSTRIGPEGLTFRQWEDDRLPDGFVGSAVVVADRPVVVVANLESDVFVGDPVMLYNGIPIK
ncbi:MAG: hypothetical protein AB7G21_03720 [Dehalococcoidia bacterium]